MISSDYVDQLLSAGIFLTTDRLHRSTSTRIGQNPLLLIDELSEELSEEEVALLCRFSAGYQEWFHGNTTQRNLAYGHRANTVTLRKTRLQDDSWKYRRMTWTDPSAWAPMTGVTLTELLTIHLEFDVS